jgi:hypothetical protein
MRGLADSDSLTGKLQRALSDEWQLQSTIVRAADLWSVKTRTVTACLERLVREGRAESRIVTNPAYVSGGYTEYRRCRA